MKDLYSLTNPQKSIWLTEQYYQNTSIGNISGTILIDDIVDFPLLEKALNIYVQKNDSIRLHLILQNNEEIKQYVSDFNSFSIPIINVENDKELEKLNKEIAETPFSLIDSDLFKFTLIRFPNNHGGLQVTFHHLIADAWTMSLFIDETMDIYSKLLNKENVDTSINFSYLNYVAEEKIYNSSLKFKKDEEYWNTLFNSESEIAFVKNYKNKNMNTKAIRKIFHLDKNLYKNIATFCKENKLSIFTFFMSIYSIYLSKINNLEDVTIGTPILNRTNFKEKHTAGMFISTIPFHSKIEADLDFTNFASNVATNQLSMFRHQRYPYQELLKNLKQNYQNVSNLYDIALSYQNARDNNINSTINYHTKWFFNGHISDSLEIHFYDMDNTETLDIYYDYQVSKLEESEINSMHNRILHMINQILNNKTILIKNIDIITSEEKRHILSFNHNAISKYPSDKNIITLFNEQVELNPNNIAVTFENETLTYKELDEKSSILAHFLIEQNISPQNVVALFMDKSLECIISILAILKVGAIYLPIDIDYPNDRISYILKDSNAKCILTYTKYLNNLNYEIPVIPIDLIVNEKNTYSKNSISSNLSSDSIAYIMYTSGSTGTPKGVLITHKGIIRLVKNTNYIEFNKGDRILQTGSIVFDACTFEIWGALLNGLELFLLTKSDLLNPTFFENYIVKNKITTLFLTTALFNKFCEFNSAMFRNLKYLLTGGEAVSKKHMQLARNSNPNLNLVHVYGPTENTTFSTFYYVKDSDKEIIPIGYPISNSSCYVVSKFGGLQPINTPGELWVGGDGVSIGYLNRPELNIDKFIDNPFGTGKVYKTGDLVQLLPDGSINFIGRIDNQVKIRGFRIELSEIDSKILTYPDIKESITRICNLSNNKVICSYVTCKKNININSLKKYLKKQLPLYMIPSYFMVLDKLPLTINGKIDTKKLPEIVYEAENIVSPSTDIEKKLHEIWTNLLKISPISIDSNFFDIGGDSLSAIKLVTEIYNKFNIELQIKDIFELNTIQDIAKYISEHSTTVCVKPNIEKSKKMSYYPTSSAQKRIYYTVQKEGENSITYNTPFAIMFDNIIDINKLEKCISTLIMRHVSLRTYFEIENSEIVQKVNDKIDYKLDVSYDNEKKSSELLKGFIKPFNLSKAPLIRSKLVIFDDNTCMLLIDIHHIICDGHSISIFIQELEKLYNDKKLEEIPYNYIDFSVWEKDYMSSKNFKKVEKYWINQFNNELPVLDMPTTYQKNSVSSNNGAKYICNINEDLSNRIYKLAKSLNTTPYMIFLSAYYILLYKYTNQTDLIVGTPTSGRNYLNVANTFGMFVNTLALRQHLSCSNTFKELLEQVTTYCLEAFQNQDYPLDMLIKKLNIDRISYKHPLFDTMFVYQNQTLDNLNLRNIHASYYTQDTKISKFDFSLEVIPNNNIFNFGFEYRTDLFNLSFIENFANNYINILDYVLNNINTNISEINMLSTNEKNKILKEFNNTNLEFDNTKDLVDIFEEQVISHPNDVAIVFENKKINYTELNNLTNIIANEILKFNVKSDNIIGIYLNRCESIPIAMLSILKSGCAYLLLDTNLPDDRIQYMLNTVNCELVITNTKLNKNQFKKIINIDKVSTDEKTSLKHIKSKYLSTVFTSGSTGAPKGILLKKSSMLNLMQAYNHKLNLKKYQNFISTCAISFDMFGVEILIPILNRKNSISSK